MIVVRYGIYVGTGTGVFGGMAITGSSSTTYEGYHALNIISNGFNCYENESEDIYVNRDSDYYNYIAFK